MANMSDAAAVRDLIQQLNDDRDAYLNTFNRIHEALIRSIATGQNGSIANVIPTSRRTSNTVEPSAISPTIASLSSLRRPHGSINLGQDVESIQPRSVFSSGTGEGEDDSGDDESFFVHLALPQTSSNEEALRLHLKHHNWNQYGRQILGPVLEDPSFLEKKNLFQDETQTSKDETVWVLAQLYEVGADGAALLFRPQSQELWHTVWYGLCNTNQDSTKRQAVGQIAVLREPSPLLFGAIHHALNADFDMDGIFDILAHGHSTQAYMKGCYEEDKRKQRTFIFALNYYTIVGEECKPKPWQTADKDLSNTVTHIPLTSCCSIVALSLGGNPVSIVKSKSRRSIQRAAHVYDPFAPWKVLNIQCYPDWKSTVDGHEANRHYVNGPEAFLVTLLIEYRDAQKRFLEINKRIVALATPPVSHSQSPAVVPLYWMM